MLIKVDHPNLAKIIATPQARPAKNFAITNQKFKRNFKLKKIYCYLFR